MKSGAAAKHIPGKPIFRTILLAMLTALAAELLLLAGSLYMTNVIDQLNQNAIDILQKQVENRQNYLESTMISNQDLTLLEDSITSKAEELLEDGTIQLETLDRSSDNCLPLMEAVSQELLSTLRNNSVTGVFLVINTHDLNQRSESDTLPCLYIRDLDPASPPSERYSDLQLLRSPIQMVESLGITTDKVWAPTVRYEALKDDGFFYPVFQAAWVDGGQLSPSDYGHWTTTPYTLSGDDHPTISYSVPLILSDGTVYGVVGVEMLVSYLQSILPYSELQNNQSGDYLLAVAHHPLESGNSIQIQEIACTSGADAVQQLPSSFTLTPDRHGGYQISTADTVYHAAAVPLTLYNRNAPFSSEQWLLIGTVSEDQLYAFSHHVMQLLALCILLTLLTGLLTSLFAARNLAHPISKLSKEVADAQEHRSYIPTLSPTGIRELDQFSSAITQLSRDILDSSTKFLRIMEMASVEIGGYELRTAPEGIYVTDNLLPMLGISHVDPSTLTVQQFRDILQNLDTHYTHKPASNGAELYHIPLPNGESRYLRIETTSEASAQVGLVEDVTSTTLEKLRIEHERDFDSLTGLYSRRAFQRECEALFRTPERLKHAALMMLDLDNLKHTNDTYGHDWGDQYIRETGRCFAVNCPPGTLCARISGDEFNLFFYGYPSQEEIRKAVQHVQDALNRTTIQLPSGRELRISISGGISWYPEDCTTLSTMKKYADFAMYQVKHSQKGALGEFDLGVYNQEAYALQSRNEFHRLIKEELVTYHFQPIVSAHSGQILAFEALMRVDLPTLHTPTAVMKLAREEDCLHEIERITLFHSAEAFQALQKNGHISGSKLLFINSIANQNLSPEESQEFLQKYSDLLPQMVIEITEEDGLDLHALEIKRSMLGDSGAFALDDYGSGYNNGKSLLELSPRYIKVDLSIVRDIDIDVDKQQIVAGIVDYAHCRGMQIVAEGLETAAEVQKVLELGVDLLQGFYLARPSAVPDAINPAALTLISNFHNRTPH